MTEEKKQNEEVKLDARFKDISSQDIIDELCNRHQMAVVATEKGVQIKKKCDLYHLIALVFEAQMELFLALKKAKASNQRIVPASNVPKNFKM